jgi:hypothetical protein
MQGKQPTTLVHVEHNNALISMRQHGAINKSGVLSIPGIMRKRGVLALQGGII